VEALDLIVHILLGALAAIVAAVLLVLAWLEAVLGHTMTGAGVPREAQEIVAVVIAVLCIVAALRLLGGFIRVVLVVVLLALLAHALLGHGIVAPTPGVRV
jgi:hypothetical protein